MEEKNCIFPRSFKEPSNPPPFPARGIHPSAVCHRLQAPKSRFREFPPFRPSHPPFQVRRSGRPAKVKVYKDFVTE